MPGAILHVCATNQPASFRHPLGRYYNRPISQIRKKQHREVVSYPVTQKSVQNWDLNADAVATESTFLTIQLLPTLSQLIHPCQLRLPTGKLASSDT